MKPFFSIVVPVFNTAPYLRECLDSVLAQLFDNWECICVDDGSTDGSGTILDEYVARDNRFKVLHQANAGVSAARNAALDIARGEWLCFLDADDKVADYWLQNIAQGAKDHPEADWIRTSYRDWHEGREPLPWPEDSPHRREERVFKNVPEIVWKQMASAGFIVLNVYRRSMVGILRFDTSIWFAEDACFSADYMHRSKCLLTIPDDSYRYRLRADSATHVLKTFGDTAIALGNILERWKTIPGEPGAFTPSVLRHAGRCRKTMTREENRAWLAFLRRAWSKRFFMLREIHGNRRRTRWFLYLVSGRPGFLLQRFGFRWLLPFKWAKE